MRVLTGLAASCLAALAASSQVYELHDGQSPNAANVPFLSPVELMLALSQRLGLSRFLRLGHNGALPVQHLDLLGDDHGMGMFQEDGEQGQFVLSIAGMSGTIPSDRPLQQLAVKNIPKSSAFADLLMSFVDVDKEWSGDKPVYTWESPGGSGVCVGPTKEDKERNKDWRDYTAPDLSPGDSLGTESERIAFFEEYLFIRNFIYIALEKMPTRRLAFCHSQAMEALVETYGPDSTEAKTAAKLYLILRNSIPSDVKSTILYLPSTASTAPDASVFRTDYHRVSRRGEEPLSVTTPSSPPSGSVGSPHPGHVARCHLTKESCRNATSNCSGRGECRKYPLPPECWTCSCKATVSNHSGGGRTTQWAGGACQKEDISIPFNILLFFTVATLLVTIWAVGLLYSIGNEPLPSVLSAGVAPPKRG